MIEQLSNFLAHKLINQYDDSSDSPDIEVIQYGIECVINTAVPLVLIFAYSICCDSVFEMITWVVTFLLLRNYLGGYHASSHISCMILSSFYGILSIHIIDTIQNLPLEYMILTGCIYFILNIFAGPIIHDNDLEHKNPRQKVVQLRDLIKHQIFE